MKSSQGILYTTRPLSGRSFVLTAEFDQSKVPLEPELDDRLFDPELDIFSHDPEIIGDISKTGQKFFGKAPNLTVTALVKTFNKDRYRIPSELALFTEFIQKSISHEHQRNPNATGKAALLKISKPHPGGEAWHFDVKANTKGPIRTYCCANTMPTQYAKIRFDPSSVDFPYSSERAHEFMLAAS